MSERVVILISSLSSDQIQAVNMRRLEDLITGKQLQMEKIDGVLPENKEIRDHLFGISGQRGKYPQCFIFNGSNYRFIGMWDDIESLVDCDGLPANVLEGNPSINTFSKVFGNIGTTK